MVSGVKGATFEVPDYNQEPIDTYRQYTQMDDTPSLIDIVKETILRLSGANSPPPTPKTEQQTAKDYFRFFPLASTDKIDYYLETTTLTVIKDDNNRIYYDIWLLAENKQEIQELNVITNQYEPGKRRLNFVVPHHIPKMAS